MATFVEVGSLRINIDNVAYIEKLSAGLRVRFVGDQPEAPILTGKDADAFLLMIGELAKKPTKRTKPSLVSDGAASG